MEQIKKAWNKIKRVNGIGSCCRWLCFLYSSL